MIRVFDQVLLKISNGTHRFVKFLCITLLLLMTLDVLNGVFFRYVLNNPLRWPEEVARLLMVWVGLIGIPLALKTHEHTGLRIFLQRFSHQTRRWLNLSAYLGIFVFLVFLLYQGIIISRDNINYLPALQISWTWSLTAVPVSAAFQLIHLTHFIVHEVYLSLSKEKA